MYNIVGDKPELFVIMIWHQAVDKWSYEKRDRVHFNLDFVVH